VTFAWWSFSRILIIYFRDAVTSEYEKGFLLTGSVGAVETSGANGKGWRSYWCLTGASSEPVEQDAQLAYGCLSALDEQMIEAILERCAGIDIGKKFVVVCVVAGGAKDDPHTQIKKFGPIVSELERRG